MKYKKLFETNYIKKLKLKNRIAMASMGPIGYADANFAFNQRLQDYYVARAKGGVGLIITGLCSVDIDIEGISNPVMPCPTYNPIAFIHNATQMNERVHAYGTKILLQLTAGMGRSAKPSMPKKFIAPSPQENRFDKNILHYEMTKEEIKNTIKKFGTSAKIAKRSGFDGVEVHAVHEGYLLDQFAISFYNHRNDEYGGSLENRLRFAIEIVKEIKKECGEDFVVSLRYSLKSCMKGLREGGLPGENYQEVGRDIEEGIEAAKLLVDAGYDCLNVDVGTYDSWYWNHPPMYFKNEGIYCEYGEILKKQVHVPVLLAGRMENPEMAEKQIGKSCDIVCIGRQLLADEDYVEKVRRNQEALIRPCLGCHEGCMGRISKAPVSCAVNPSCGREEIYKLFPALIKKNVLVVGGGPAGLEAARVLALRGHNVSLVEKNNDLGGNLIPGGTPDFKKYDLKLVEWYKKQLDLLKVKIRFNKEIVAKDIIDSHYDVIITATGSQPIEMRKNITSSCCTADQVLLGKKMTGDVVVIIGGGLVGCETALWLSEQGKKVIVIEKKSKILNGGLDLPFMNYSMLVDLIKYNNIKVYTDSIVTDINQKKIIFRKNNVEETLLCDCVINAIGYKSNDNLYEEIKETDKEIYNIGDSKNVKNVMYAIWDAYEVARNI